MEAVLIHESPYYFVFGKPPNIHSTGKKDDMRNSFAALLLAEYPGLALAAPKEFEAGLVNRLDFETSGILIAARSREAWNTLHELFTSGAVTKEYLCCIEGKMEGPAEVEGFIASRYRGSKKVTVLAHPSSTYASVQAAKSLIKTIHYHDERDFSLASVITSTGRRHQVRAHCGSIRYPLMGDSLYGAKRTLAELPEYKPGWPAFILHARRVSFMDPFELKEVEFVIGLPEEYSLFSSPPFASNS